MQGCPRGVPVAHSTFPAYAGSPQVKGLFAEPAAEGLGGEQEAKIKGALRGPVSGALP